MNDEQDQHARETDARDLQEMRAIIARALDIKVFMAGDAGRFLQARANTEIASAQEQLIEVDPTKTEEIRALQNQAKVAARVLLWLGEAVTEGENAERAFIEQGG